MIYCEAGQRPVIIYKFNDSPERRYLSNIAPIDIVVQKQNSIFEGGQCNDLYYVFWDTNASNDSSVTDGSVIRYDSSTSSPFYGPIIDSRAYHNYNTYIYQGSVTQILSHGWATFSEFAGSNGQRQNKPVWNSIHFSGATDEYRHRLFIRITRVVRFNGLLDNCGNLPILETIEIKHGSILLFADSGEPPCTFTVQCGDCPPGTVKCKSSGYPGYCCIPCNTIAQQINNLANKL